MDPGRRSFALPGNRAVESAVALLTGGRHRESDLLGTIVPSGFSDVVGRPTGPSGDLGVHGNSSDLAVSVGGVKITARVTILPSRRLK